MSFKKIAVATDFSEIADIAVKQALAIARHSGAELCLIHASTTPQSLGGGPDSISSVVADYDRMLRERFAQLRDDLSALRQRVSGQGVDVSQVVVDGFPDAEIPKLVESMGADMLVVGSHGRTGLKWLLMGSVAECLVRNCNRTTLVARAVTSEGAFRRILVPIDFSEHTRPAIRAALAVADPGATVELFHAWQLPGSAWLSAGWDHRWGELKDATLAANEKLGAELIAEHSVETEALLVFRQDVGVASSAIGTRLGQTEFDLVTLGSHGHRGVRRWMLGSVAEAVVRHAPCSVMVVHLGEQA